LPILIRPAPPPIARNSPLLRGLAYFLLTFLLVVLGMEALGRSPLAGFLPPSSLKVDNFLLEAKIHALELQTRRVGRLDCLFLGSSVTNSDIDPSIVEQIYRQQTGETIHCFNLGLPALTTETATALAEVILPRFRPKVIFYSILPRDIRDTIANVDYLLDTPWVKFYRGAPSLEGWLLHHAYSYRYYLAWRYWLVIPNRLKQLQETHFLTPKGFQPAQGIRDPYLPNLTMTSERLRAAWSTPQERHAFQALLSLQRKGVRLIILEGPAYHEPDGSDAETWAAYYESYLPPLLELLQTYGAENGIGAVPFWETQALARQIPKAHWYDWLHLNSQGAITFSRWLGQQIAQHPSLFR